MKERSIQLSWLPISIVVVIIIIIFIIIITCRRVDPSVAQSDCSRGVSPIARLIDAVSE